MFVITGATGNTGKPIAQALLKAGKKVTVVGRSSEKLSDLVTHGALAAIGSLEDTDFLKKTFQGATAVYALIPPNFGAKDFRAYQNSIGNALIEAIQFANVKHVVFLSSIGAHLPEGTGVLKGLYDFEKGIEKLKDVNVLHLRAGFFMENIFGMLGVIKQAGVLGGFPIRGDIQIPLIATKDIADIATHHLLTLDFKGHKSIDIANGEKLTLNDIAKKLGQAISKPDLTYVQFPYDQSKAAMIQMGASLSLADAYEEFSKFLNENEAQYLSEFNLTTQSTGKTTLNDFLPHLAGAYLQV